MPSAWWRRGNAAAAAAEAEAALRGCDAVPVRLAKRRRVAAVGEDDAGAAPNGHDEESTETMQEASSRTKSALLVALRDRINRYAPDGEEQVPNQWEQKSVVSGTEVATHPLTSVWNREFSDAEASHGQRDGLAVELEVVPKSWDDEHLRLPLPNEKTCANKMSCEGVVLLGWPLVAYETPREKRREIQPRADGLCLCCLRASVTRSWMRAFSQGAPVHRVAQPFRSVFGEGEYGAHAFLPRATATFHGVTDEFVQHVRCRYVASEDGTRLRQVDVDFEEVPHVLLRQCMVETVRRHTVAEGPSMETAQAALRLPEFSSCASALARGAGIPARLARRVAALSATRKRPDLTRDLPIALWSQATTDVQRVVRAAIPMGLQYPLRFSGFSQKLQRAVDASGDACAVVAFALVQFLGLNDARVVGEFLLSPRHRLSRFVQRNALTAMAAIFTLVVRAMRCDGVVMQVACEESGTLVSDLVGMEERLRACVRGSDTTRTEQALHDAFIACKLRLTRRVWFWRTLARMAPSSQPWDALRPFPELASVDPRWAYDAPESLAFALTRRESRETLAAAAAAWRDESPQNRRDHIARMRRIIKTCDARTREDVARLAAMVVGSFSVRVVPAPSHWGASRNRNPRMVLFCASCESIKTQVLGSIEKFLKSKRDKSRSNAVVSLMKASAKLGSEGVSFDAETRRYYCAKRQVVERNERGADGVLNRLRAVGIYDADADSAVATAASAPTRGGKSRQSCGDAACFAFRAHGNVVEFYGTLVAMCWRCGCMCELREFGDGVGVECGWCTATDPTKKCFVCRVAKRSSSKLPWSTLVVLRGPGNPRGLSEIHLCPRHALPRSSMAKPVHEWSLLCPQLPSAQ